MPDADSEAAPNTRVGEGVAGRVIFGALILSIGYAVLRYHLAGPVPWKDFPLYILNKGISLAAFLLLTLNFSLGPLKNLGVPVSPRWLEARKAIGMTSFLLVLFHVLLSVLLYRPEIYGSFFESDGTPTLFAGLSMLTGVAAFVVLWGYNMAFQTSLRNEPPFLPLITSRRFLLFALTLGAFHLFFMGITGWLEPASWHAHLPPISLVSFVTFLAGYLINLLGRR